MEPVTGQLDVNALIQMILGPFGALIIVVVVLLQYKTDRSTLGSLLNESQEARIKNLEAGQQACETRVNTLIQHILTMKNKE